VDSPSTWLCDQSSRLPHIGTALDVVCGRGRHALWLARHGLAVTAIDREPTLIANLQDVAEKQRLHIETRIADLETGDVTHGIEAFDAIVVVHYLHRPLFPALRTALRRNGLLIYETFTRAQARLGKPTNPDFLLMPGELSQLVAPLEILDAREGFLKDGTSRRWWPGGHNRRDEPVSNVRELPVGSGVQPGDERPRWKPRPEDLYRQHGETASNAERRVVGQLDQPLNQRGREQAEALRATLSGVHFDAIYTSPLSRGLDTAAIIADGRPVRVLNNLRERNQGRFQGLLADTQPDFARRMTDPRDDLGGGETSFQLDTRARAALNSIRRAQPTGSVLIVGHFLTNQMILKELLGITIQQAMSITQANDELFLVELTPLGRPRAWKLIGRTHLSDL
jgi:broad specificity phosphatase PhoE